MNSTFPHILLLNLMSRNSTLTYFSYFTVPIIPQFLYDIRHPEAPLDSLPIGPPTTPAPPPPCINQQSAPPSNRTELTTAGYGNILTGKYINLFGMTSSVLLFENVDESGANATMIYEELQERHKELVGETVEVGLMFASKAFVQLLANPIVGPLTHK